MLAGFDIDNARGCVVRVPVLLPHTPIDAGAVVSVSPVLALLLGGSFVPVEWTNSATAACCRCSAALVFFRPLSLVAATVPVVASPQGCSGLSLLMFFSVILASGHGLISARPGGVLCPLGFVDAVCVAAGGGSGGGNIF